MLRTASETGVGETRSALAATDAGSVELRTVVVSRSGFGYWADRGERGFTLTASPVICVLALWAAWFASWLLARGWSKATIRRPAPGAETLYAIVVDAGFILMTAPVFRALGPRLWSWRPAAAWALAGLAALGFAICWWARLRLARHWSWGVTLKESHEIVDHGPYAVVRHPIYTGLIIAAAATTLLQAKALSVVGFAMMVAGLWIKARLEERFLRVELGEATYGAYAARTGMLFPRL